MERMWQCDTCKGVDKIQPWECPGCKTEVCEHCFVKFAHCKSCCLAMSDKELIESANNTGDYNFEEEDG